MRPFTDSAARTASAFHALWLTLRFSCGNGNLTDRIRPVDGNSANDRTESFSYDFRDRLIGESYVSVSPAPLP